MKNNILIVTFSIFFIIVAFSFQSVVSFCGTIEDIKEELGQETKTKVETRNYLIYKAFIKTVLMGVTGMMH